MSPKLIIYAVLMMILLSFDNCTNDNLTPVLIVSENKRFLSTENGDPFFWLSDTGWLLFQKLSREEAAKYFDIRRSQGFNVIQVMVIQNLKKNSNFYGDSALAGQMIDKPFLTEGNSPDDPEQYDYWDHVDYLVKLAHEKGIYLALVPIWGSNVRSGEVALSQARKYAEWLAGRYRNEPNIIWLNGGDVKGSDSTDIWNAIGSTIREISPEQLISYHPFGRTQSSQWFHNEAWLDFNMFQSGHRRYDQDTTGLSYGEDNWKYMASDYNLSPVKPSLDGEPSYESIPQGLHDPSQPRWTAADVRRYAYWSVFAGGCGFTYGHNAVMQFHKSGDPDAAYGVKENWDEALNAQGASQMVWLKSLILSKPYFERVPAQEILAGENGKKYDYVAATRGKNFAFAYTCNGSDISIDSDRLGWKEYKASWYNPRDGSYSPAGTYKTGGINTFDAPGEIASGNDWVLVLDSVLK
jgi:hypothetical protein